MNKGRQARSVFGCSECGYESLKWLGRCPECSSWNSFVERAASAASQGRNASVTATSPVELSEMSGQDEPRVAIGLPEFDRVLGGGVVAGSLMLIGGDPGIGKSTLLLQVAALASARGRPVLYLSGEESARQVKIRAERLGLSGRGLFLLAETNLDAALREAEKASPAMLIIDSIQTVYTESAPQAAGSIAQLRQCTLELMRWAKGCGVPVAIVGHVTKDGDIAGPRLLEHIVDVVLYLEGERFSHYRLLRGVKNRFGSVDEVGIFEMTEGGLRGVENASAALIEERAGGVGSVVAPTLEGSRPLLVEVQALTNPTVAPSPRRTANGLDVSRLQLVAAVLSRRLSLPLAAQDIIASVAGGLRVHEPAVDLAVALAIVSSHRDEPVPSDLVAIGEIGLSGELRSVGRIERRLGEAERLGFKRCLLPEGALRRQQPRSGMRLLPAATLREAVRLALGGNRRQALGPRVEDLEDQAELPLAP